MLILSAADLPLSPSRPENVLKRNIDKPSNGLTIMDPYRPLSQCQTMPDFKKGELAPRDGLTQSPLSRTEPHPEDRAVAVDFLLSKTKDAVSNQ